MQVLQVLPGCSAVGRDSGEDCPIRRAQGVGAALPRPGDRDQVRQPCQFRRHPTTAVDASRAPLPPPPLPRGQGHGVQTAGPRPQGLPRVDRTAVALPISLVEKPSHQPHQHSNTSLLSLLLNEMMDENLFSFSFRAVETWEQRGLVCHAGSDHLSVQELATVDYPRPEEAGPFRGPFRVRSFSLGHPARRQNCLGNA